MKPTTSDWRTLIKVHPAADDFPLLLPDELKDLAEDIKANGLTSPVTTWRDKDGTEWLLDGRNRLDAMAAAGYHFKLHAQWRPDKARDPEQFKIVPPKAASHWALNYVTHHFGDDPDGYVESANVKRRHLTIEQRKAIAAEILKRRPERSDRSIAKETKLSDKTVAAVRKDANAEIPNKTDRIEASGRKARGHKPTGADPTQPSAAKPAAHPAREPDEDDEPGLIIGFEDPAHLAFITLYAEMKTRQRHGALKHLLPHLDEKAIAVVVAAVKPKSTDPLGALKAAWKAAPVDVRKDFLVLIHERNSDFFHATCKIATAQSDKRLRDFLAKEDQAAASGA